MGAATTKANPSLALQRLLRSTWKHECSRRTPAAADAGLSGMAGTNGLSCHRASDALKCLQDLGPEEVGGCVGGLPAERSLRTHII